jgi:putative hydrolase of HD superfamily
VAEHSLRAAQIAYVIAVLEGSDHPERVCAMLVFHDMTEARTRDAHKVASRYIPEIRHEQAASEQLQDMGEVGTSIRELWDEIEHRSTPDGIIAKDADYLEMAFSGKELVERGFADAQDWIDNVEQALKTKSAKELLSALKQTRSTDWWKGLKRLS